MKEQGPVFGNPGIMPTGTYGRLRLVTCRVDLSDNLTCEKERVVGTAEVDGAPGPVEDNEGFTPKKWNGHKKLVIGPTGETKLEPAD